MKSHLAGNELVTVELPSTAVGVLDEIATLVLSDIPGSQDGPEWARRGTAIVAVIGAIAETEPGFRTCVERRYPGLLEELRPGA